MEESKRKVTIRTLEEKKALCEEWKTSGKTKREFCKENNIPIASFFPWCNKLLAESKKQEANLFPVKIINKPSISSNEPVTQTEIEISFENGLAVHFTLPIKELVTFIQELSHAITTIR
jgi:hypothetical protein